MSDPVKASLEELRALAGLIQTSIDTIETTCIASGQPFPSLSDPFTLESEAIRMAPDVQQASTVLIAAAAQLTAIVQSPVTTAMQYGFKFHISTALRVAIESHVPEILREAGPQGLHVKDIAARTGTDAGKLARILRLLASHHMFREVAPDTFAYNRIAAGIDTGKKSADAIADPAAKFDNGLAFPAALNHVTDETLKASAYLQEVLADPAISGSGDPSKTSFNRAHNTKLPIFEWFELPENAHRLRRFSMAMTGLSAMSPPDAIAKGFDWNALPQGSVVVDVGGGVGSQSLALAKAFDHLQFVVQDRASVITGSAPSFWENNLPAAIPSGRVTLQAHDFFEEQQVREPAVFMMRMILHDWADEYSIKILRRLRAAAGLTTQLVIIDNIATYACGDPEEIQNITGAKAPVAPAPLLPNFGVSGAFTYFSDMQMMNLMNSVERTIPQFVELFKKGGWKVVEVYRPFGGMMVHGCKIIGVPAEALSE